MDLAKSDEIDSSASSDGNCEDRTVKRSPYVKNLNRATSYLTPNARQYFIQLRQAFTEVQKLQHFDLECHIWIETDASGYTVGGVLS